MKSILLLYSIVISLIAVGCSAPTVFDLNPADEEFNYHQGRVVVSREDSVAATLLNFEYHEGSNFSFYTEITNNSNESFLVDPAQFYAEILKPSAKGDVTLISVIDPETKIQLIEEDISSNEASKKTAIGMNMLLGLFNAVVDIASEAPAGKFIDDMVYWGNNANNEAIEHDIEKENLQNMKRHWINNVLRKTTLAPGEYFGGVFYLPVQYDAKLIKLILPLNSTRHEFIFQQKRMN